MRAVLQRVKEASVSVEGEVISRIGSGLLALVGVEEGDTNADADYIASKLTWLRIFPDKDGKMNCTCIEAGGEALLVSQFTLLGDASKGRRPSFVRAAHPDKARPLMDSLVSKVGGAGLGVSVGRFGAHMEVALVNDGPVTILLDSRKKF